MSADQHLIHPLIHHGTSQTDRLLAALLPANLQLDDRSIQDLMVASYRYAELLQYYNEDNQRDGDWRCFWEVETLTFLAVLAELETDEILQQFNTLEIDFSQDIEEGAGGPLDPGGEQITNYYDQAEFIFRLAQRINQALRELPSDLPLYRELCAMVDKRSIADGENLVDALYQLITIHKAVYYQEHGEALPHTRYTEFEGIKWGLADSNAYDAIKFAATFDRATMRALFRRFFEVLLLLRQRAQYWFNQQLNSPQLHQPHVALYLTFLRLFHHAQNSLNALTGQHLNYYYEQVLCLARREALSDEVYLVLELAKGFEENRIEKGTAFLAGKDANGKPLLFDALEEYVVRAAQVAEMKTTYFGLCPAASQGKILANPDVNIAYAEGAEDPAGQVISWRAMGDNEDLPRGEIGFAIASPQLILREGFRVIDVELAVDLDSFSALGASFDTADIFKIALSSGEEWLEPTKKNDIAFSGDITTIGSEISAFNYQLDAGILHFRIVLEKDELPVVALSGEQDVYKSEWPVLKVLLKQFADDGTPYCQAELYDAIRQVRVREITITVDVTGIRENLIVQSDQGVFDGTQKVLPFGAVPGVGRKFYVGSTEIFQKALQELKVNFDWVDIPQMNSFRDYYCHYDLAPYQRPDPSVQIEFIDRADDTDINIQQITRINEFFFLGLPANIQVNVGDVNFNALNNVGVTSLTPEITVDGITTDPNNPGTIFVTLRNTDPTSPPIFPGSSIGLLFTPQDNPDLQPITLYLNQNGATGFGTWATEFELVFFPRQLDVSPAQNITLLVESADGQPLTNVAVNTSPGATVQNPEDNVYIIPATVDSFTVDADNYQASGVITNSGFNIYQVALTPDAGSPANARGLVDATFEFPVEPTGTITIAEEMPNRTGYRELFSGVLNALSHSVDRISGQSVMSFISDTGEYQSFAFVANFYDNFNLPLIPASIPDPDIGQRGDVPDGQHAVQLAFNNAAFTEYSRLTLSSGGSAVTFTTGTVNGTTALLVDDTVTTLRIESPFFLPIEITWGTDENYASATLILRAFGIHDNGLGNDVAKVFVGDAQGNALQNVNVVLIDETGTPITSTTDVNGEASFTGLDTSLSYPHLTVVPPNAAAAAFSPAGSTVELRGNAVAIATGIVAVSRIGETNFTGIVRSVRGDAVPHARVSINGTVVYAAESGEFALSLGSPPAGTLAVIVDHPLFETFNYNDAISARGLRLNVELSPRPTLQGYAGEITDIFGTALPNARIEIPWGQSADDTLQVAQANTAGEYQLLLPPGTATFSVDAGDSYELFNFPPNSETFPLSGTPDNLNLIIYPGEVAQVPLFLSDPQTPMQDCFDISINGLNLSRDVRTQEFSRYDPTLKRGFLRFTLKGTDFGHNIYPNLLAAYTIDASVDGSNLITTHPCGTYAAGGSFPYLPNPAYTPATNGISVNYKSRQVIPIAIAADEEPNDGIERYFHLLPFMGYRNNALTTGRATYVLDPFFAQDQPSVTDFGDGNLYIGLENAKADTILSLLFQIEEGSEEKTEWQPPELVWSYLTKNNQWQRFRTQEILADSTNGLTKSGLVKLHLPKIIARENTMLNPAYHWLRVAAVEDRSASPPKSVRALPGLVSVHAQAIQVRFDNQDNDVAHLAQPLPAGTIGKLQVSRTAIKKVEQPFDSFGGQLPETGDLFYRRISERLRHRDRAIQIWDYERLLLEQFPKVHRVKCLPHTMLNASPDDCGTVIDESTTPTIAPDLSVTAPGHVLLAVIPDLRQRTATAQAEPRFSFGDLLDMEAYLRTKTNLFVRWQNEDEPWLMGCPPADFGGLAEKYLWVVNPRYELIRLRFSVAFRSGYDPTFYRFELDQAIKHYLAPWLADDGYEISFGNSISRSRLIAFIEGLEYVDVIADFEIYKAPSAALLHSVCDGTSTDCLVTTEQVLTDSPRAVLTTYANPDKDPEETDHCITVLDDKNDICTSGTTAITGGRTGTGA